MDSIKCNTAQVNASTAKCFNISPDQGFGQGEDRNEVKYGGSHYGAGVQNCGAGTVYALTPCVKDRE